MPLCTALPLLLLLASLPHGRGFALWANPARVGGAAESSGVATPPGALKMDHTGPDTKDGYDRMYSTDMKCVGPPWINGSKVAPFEEIGYPMAPNVVVVAMTARLNHQESGYGTTPPIRTLLCRLLHSAALNNVPMAIFGYENARRCIRAGGRGDDALLVSTGNPKPCSGERRPSSPSVACYGGRS
jgi:hypothetical protein